MKLVALMLMPALCLPLPVLALDAPKESCANIQWNADFLKRYPKAPVACREITLIDGVKYAQFNGKVTNIGGTVVQVDIYDVANIPISAIGLQIGVGGRVTVNGTEIHVRDLHASDILTFWVSEGQFGISPSLTERPLRIIKPTPMKPNETI